MVIDELGDVPRDEPVPQRSLEGAVDDAVDVQDRRGAQPRAQPVVVQPVEVLRRELRQRHRAHMRHDVDADVLLVARPRGRPQSMTLHRHPRREEAADGLALARQRQPVAVRLERSQELPSDLLAGPA